MESDMTRMILCAKLLDEYPIFKDSVISPYSSNDFYLEAEINKAVNNEELIFFSEGFNMISSDLTSEVNLDPNRVIN